MSRYNVTLKPMGLLRHIELDADGVTPKAIQNSHDPLGLTFTKAHGYPFIAVFEAGLGREASDYWKWSWGIPRRGHWEFEHSVADGLRVRISLQDYFQQQFGTGYKGFELHPVSYFTQENGDGARNDPVTGTPSRLNIRQFGLDPLQKWFVTTGVVVLEEMLAREPISK